MLETVIVIDPEVMNGTPCFRGTRVPFKNLIDYLEGGHSLGEFLQPVAEVQEPLTNVRGSVRVSALQSRGRQEAVFATRC